MYSPTFLLLLSDSLQIRCAIKTRQSANALIPAVLQESAKVKLDAYTRPINLSLTYTARCPFYVNVNERPINLTHHPAHHLIHHNNVPRRSTAVWSDLNTHELLRHTSLILNLSIPNDVTMILMLGNIHLYVRSL